MNCQNAAQESGRNRYQRGGHGLHSEFQSQGYKEHATQSNGQHIELAGLKKERFFSDEHIAQQPAAHGVDDADHDRRGDAELSSERLLNPDHSISTQTQGIEPRNDTVESDDMLP